MEFGAVEQVTGLWREVSDTIMLLLMAGVTLGGYLGLAFVLIHAIRAIGAVGS